MSRCSGEVEVVRCNQQNSGENPLEVHTVDRPLSHRIHFACNTRRDMPDEMMPLQPRVSISLTVRFLSYQVITFSTDQLIRSDGRCRFGQR